MEQRFRFYLKDILKRLKIKRQTFYDMNKKYRYFRKTTHWIYECTTEVLNKVEKYYEMKFARIKCRNSIAQW